MTDFANVTFGAFILASTGLVLDIAVPRTRIAALPLNRYTP